MSREYNNYLTQHKSSVRQGFYWIRENLPELARNPEYDPETLEYQICFEHDASKTDMEEYCAYDEYFYGKNCTQDALRAFNIAWLRHIHKNPHHWQHWVLINDDPNEGETILDMPWNYILEMICDWWAFSWNKGNLREIFDWYEKHKDYMKLSDKTRETVEYILRLIKSKLDELEGKDGE